MNIKLKQENDTDMLRLDDKKAKQKSVDVRAKYFELLQRNYQLKNQVDKDSLDGSPQDDKNEQDK